MRLIVQFSVINLFKYVHITKLQRQEWYCFMHGILQLNCFTSYCYIHIQTVFNSIKRRHILSLSMFCLKQNRMHHLQSFITFCKKKTPNLFSKEYAGKVGDIWTRIKYLFGMTVIYIGLFLLFEAFSRFFIDSKAIFQNIFVMIPDLKWDCHQN